MNKVQKMLFQKLVSSYLLFSLILSQFFPLFSIVGQAYANQSIEVQNVSQAQKQEIATATFNAQTHTISLTLTNEVTEVNNQVPTQYAIFYEHEGVLQGAQGAFTSTTTEVFLGSQSGEDAIKATPKRIIVKTQTGATVTALQIESDFAAMAGENEALSFVSYDAESLELTEGESLWVRSGLYEVTSVELNTTYVYPSNSTVSVTFTKLPEEGGNLKIQEITLSDEVAQAIGLTTKTAYEITSSMENGNFEYDLTLPNPFETDEVEVQFSEDGENFEQAEGDSLQVQDKNEYKIVKITGLDHFTVFVVVPDDIVSSNISQFFQQGWRMTSQGNAAIALASTSSLGIPENAGPHSIRLNRAGGAGTNRSYLGYYETGLELADIEAISWNRYTLQGNDTYLNIFLNDGLQTATVVYNPATATGSWQANTFNSSSTGITIRVGGVTTPISYADLMANYGDWNIRNDAFTYCTVSGLACLNPANWQTVQIGGIVFVSGSSSPTLAQNHVYDNITLDFVGQEPQNFDFVETPPTFQTITLGQETASTYAAVTRNGIPACTAQDHVYTNQNVGGQSRQVLEWTPIAGAQSYQFRSFRWNGSNWVPTGAAPVTISATADYTVTGYDVPRFNNTAGFTTYTEFDSTNNVFRYITMGTAEGMYTRSVKAFSGTNATGYLIGDTENTQEDLLVGGSEYATTAVCSKLTIDRQIPLITLNQAFPATTNSSADFTSDSTPTFTGSTTDQASAGIDRVEFKVDGISGEVQAWTPATVAGVSGDITRTFSFTTGSLADGVYTVSARSYDLAGNVSTLTTQTITVDTTFPVTVITNVPNGAMLSGTVALRGTITETNLLRYFYRIQAVGGPVLTQATVYASVLNDQVFYTWDTTTVADGVYTIHLAARDRAGNRNAGSETTITVLVDNTKPVSTIVTPAFADGSTPGLLVTNTWDGSFTGTATDPIPSSGLTGVSLSIQRSSDGLYWDGAAWISQVDPLTPVRVAAGSSDTWATWNYTISGGVAEDTYTIISRAIDAAGNTDDGTQLTVVLDQTIPEIQISVNPTNPDGANNWYKTRPTITLTASDDYAVDTIVYSWGSATGPWTTYTGPFQIPGEGSYILYYKAIDTAGNETSVGAKNLAWDATTLINGPLNVKADPDRTSGSTSKITWTNASDAIGIDKYEIIWRLKNGGIEFSKTVSASTFETSIDRMNTEGEWEVIVKAYDFVGNSKEASTTVLIDRTAPSAPVLTLVGTTSGTATLSWTAVPDATRYILYYGVRSGEYIYAANVGNVTTFTVEGLAAGAYYFMVRAVDSVDNQSANSNEVSTGSIPGVVGANPFTPVAGFAPAGEVLGVEEVSFVETATPSFELKNTAGQSGQVAGVSENTCGVRSYLPWILLLILVVGGFACEFLLRSSAGSTKFAISGSLVIVTILAYYLLRDIQCFDPGTLLAFINNWFWAVAMVIAGLVRFLGYSFLEEVSVD